MSALFRALAGHHMWFEPGTVHDFAVWLVAWVRWMLVTGGGYYR
jgi:hypothetical protein